MSEVANVHEILMQHENAVIAGEENVEPITQASSTVPTANVATKRVLNANARRNKNATVSIVQTPSMANAGRKNNRLAHTNARGFGNSTVSIAQAPSTANSGRKNNRVANESTRASENVVASTAQVGEVDVNRGRNDDRSRSSAHRSNEVITAQIIPASSIRVVLHRLPPTVYERSITGNIQGRNPSGRPEQSTKQRADAFVPMNFGRLVCIVCQKKLESTVSLPKMRSVVCSYTCASKQISDEK